MELTPPKKRILVTGASGYVGGRLVPRLEKRGLRVRCLARRPEFLAKRFGPMTEVVEGDVLREETLLAALEGVHTAYYMVHSMGTASRGGFEAQDRLGAQNFARAARVKGVRRIVYLGSLGNEHTDLSPHLRSRHEVGRALRASGVPVIEFRASIVIGSGVVRDESARYDFDINPIGLEDSIANALTNEDREFAETRWSDAISASGSEARLFGSYGGVRRGRRLVDSRECELDVSAAEAFAPIRRIGGSRGWYAFRWRWRLRGFMVLLVGGVGVRRGRSDPEHLRAGDSLDWWRVETYQPDHLLRPRAEMKLPGRAWLEFEVRPTRRGSTIRQTAVFDPVGLPGLLYWYGVYPFHAAVFRGMLAGIARVARAEKGGAVGFGDERSH